MEMNDFFIDINNFDRDSFHKSVFGNDVDLNKSANDLIKSSNEITDEMYDMLLYQWCNRIGIVMTEEEASKYPSYENYFKGNK